ncbi:MAG: NnrS family protein, partial [Gammaproteobacteria bacterium]|nr:NnrS family protein [Gammaproteobacteria bacterium]
MKKTAPYPAILAYGFRPFFLLAGIHAALAIPVWMAFLHGFDPTRSPLPAQAWHAHEMLYGFITAAMAGFLLTAVPSWTGHRGYAGAPLFGLALLWLAGRIATTFPLGLSPLLIAVVDLAFVPALALTFLPTLIRSGNRRNFVFIGLLATLFAANIHFHLSGAIATAPLRTGINVMLIMVTMVGRHIVPPFTSSGLKQRGIDIRIQRHPLLDRAVFIATCAVLVVDLLPSFEILAAVVATITAMLYVLQLARWQGQRTLREPILWILHVGYAWLPVALMLKAAWLFGAPISATSWLHALTTGAFSTMILAVMSRAALGHTGRALVLSRAMVIGYYLLTGAALCRVFGPILNPAAWSLWLSSA